MRSRQQYPGMHMPGWSLWTPDEVITDAAVLVVAVDLHPGAPGSSLASGLDACEQARAARFVDDRHRRRFITAHVALRQVLGACIGMPPSELRFAAGPQGKPSLIDAGPWQFNLSHSDDLALIAVTRGRELGVDVERHRSGVAIHDLAQRFFAPAEAAALAALPVDRQEAAFFTCWSRKEAVVKALGTGLHTPLDCFTVEVDPARAARVLQQPAEWPAWQLTHLDLLPGWSGAVAVAGGGWSLMTRRMLTVP